MCPFRHWQQQWQEMDGPWDGDAAAAAARVTHWTRMPSPCSAANPLDPRPQPVVSDLCAVLTGRPTDTPSLATRYATQDKAKTQLASEIKELEGQMEGIKLQCHDKMRKVQYARWLRSPALCLFDPPARLGGSLTHAQSLHPTPTPTHPGHYP